MTDFRRLHKLARQAGFERSGEVKASCSTNFPLEDFLREARSRKLDMDIERFNSDMRHRGFYVRKKWDVNFFELI